MKFFNMEKWGKISFSIACICSIFSVLIAVYIIRISKESWNYKIDEKQCYKKASIVEEIQSGKSIQNGHVLKFIKMKNGDNICILRKDGEWNEYPNISQKNLSTIKRGKQITYLKDKKNKIDNYNVAYEIKINEKIYFPIKQMKKVEMWNYIKDIGVIAFFSILSILMIGLTVYFYWIADTKDMYIM